MEPSVWRGGEPLVLASSSPTRRALLAAAGLPCECVAPQVDERALEADLDESSPAIVAGALARAKAESVGRPRPSRLVLGADQVLAFEGGLLHKARSRDEAAERLALLSGRTHRLVSAFVLLRDGAVLASGSVEATLTLRPLDPAAISAYLDCAGGAATDSLGCYVVEELGLHLFAAIEGDHTTILGLPMLPLLAALRSLGCLSI